MPIFGLGKKSGGLSAKPHMEIGDGDPVTLALVNAANHYDWTTARAVLARYPDDDRSILLSALSRDAAGLHGWLESVHRDAQDDPLAVLAFGAATVSHAWRIRSNLQAKHVSREQFAKFHEVLREAEEILYRAVELDPASAAPWAELLTSGRGLQVGTDLIRRRFEAATARCPAHRIAHQQMLQALCRKWSGSHEQMHEFAAAGAAGPHWAQLAHLVATAHIEHWLALPAGAERSAYMKQPAVRKELEEAADLALFQPEAGHPRSPYSVANLFAMAFSLAGLHAEALRAFELTNGVVTRFPWLYGNGRDQVTLFTVWRDKARSTRTTR
jgi:hypothetical protein